MVQRKSIQGHIARTRIMKGTLERRDHRLRLGLSVCRLWVWMATPLVGTQGRALQNHLPLFGGPRMFALWINGLRSDVGSVWVSKGGSEFPSPAPCHLFKGPPLCFFIDPSPSLCLLSVCPHGSLFCLYWFRKSSFPSLPPYIPFHLNPFHMKKQNEITFSV